MSSSKTLSFDWRGLVLFLLIMIPNVIWFACPAPDDVLRHATDHKMLDSIMSVVQIAMVGSLCISGKQKRNSWQQYTTIFLFVLLYYGCWILYYLTAANAMILWGLTIFPCLAFLLLARAEENRPALFLTILFTICHMANTFLSFGL